MTFMCRRRTGEAPYAQLTPAGSDLAFRSTYHAAMIDELRARIPFQARKWDGTRKQWLVDPAYGAICADLAQTYLGVTVHVPTVAATSGPVTRLVRLEYLGRCKVREDGTSSAFGWAEGDWTVIIPETVLRDWFQAPAALPDEQPTLYAVLAVAPTAAADDIRKAHRRLAMQWHPDRCKEDGAAEQFKRIQHAYQILVDPLRRKKYDAGLVFEQQARRSLPRGREASYVQTGGYQPVLRCGYVLAEGTVSLGRFLVSAIYQWEDILDEAGRTMVSSWPPNAQRFVIDWV